MRAINQAEDAMYCDGRVVHTEKWQGVDIQDNPQARMVEVLHYTLEAPMPNTVKVLQDEVKPNLPWAENHFAERVCGFPLNPGIEWANWPWSKSADGHRAKEMFNHNYMERYWPKFAVDHPTLSPTDWENCPESTPRRGIRKEYGDLGDMVNLLAKEPFTRQAYLPVWFPEDTGSEGRKPCTLGYHFIMRDGELDVTYYIRSCDMYRHMRDDIYLTIRLAQWVLSWCRRKNYEAWKDVQLGTLRMHITSLHMFVSDYQQMFGENPK